MRVRLGGGGRMDEPSEHCESDFFVVKQNQLHVCILCTSSILLIFISRKSQVLMDE